MSITYNADVSVALVILHANAHAPYCHLWPAAPYIIFHTVHKVHFLGRGEY